MKNLIRGHTLLVMLAVACLLLAGACGTQDKVARQTETATEKEMESQSKTISMASMDSLLHNYRSLQEEMTLLKATYAEPVPQEEAKVTIPTQNLLDLPDGAKYGASYGRATVEAERSGDNIIVTGRCDSIARRCEYYERHAFRLQNTVDSLQTTIAHLESQLSLMKFERDSTAFQNSFESHESKPPRTGGKWLAAGVLLGMVLAVAFRLLWTRFNAGNFIRKAISKIV